MAADGTVKRPIGRPPKGPRSIERHEKRPVIRASEPVHITLRVADDIARKGLRKRGIYKAVREAMLVTYRDESCRIVHQSIQDSHLHLLVEADNRTALARGMHAFQISAAKHINAAVSNNWRKHGEHRKDVARTWLIDPFSTGWSFDGWKERADEPFIWKLRASYEPIMSWRPRTWLLREGWRRCGLVSVYEVPGPRRSVFPEAA